MCTLLSKTAPVARKTYRCEWCGESILPGEIHEKFVQIFEGDFQSWRAHVECVHMMDCISSEYPEMQEDGFQPHQHRRGKTYEQRVAARLKGDPEWRY
jgi:hypothetical protein